MQEICVKTPSDGSVASSASRSASVLASSAGRRCSHCGSERAGRSKRSSLDHDGQAVDNDNIAATSRPPTALSASSSLTSSSVTSSGLRDVTVTSSRPRRSRAGRVKSASLSSSSSAAGRRSKVSLVILAGETVSVPKARLGLETLGLGLGYLGRGVFGGGGLRLPPPLGGEKNVLIFNVKIMLNFEHLWKCTPEMNPLGPLLRFLNTPLGLGLSIGSRKPHVRVP